MHKFVIGVLIALTSVANHAMPAETRSLPLEQIGLEHIDIQGQIQTFRLQKVCIDEQAYLMLFKGLTEPVSISASFKDGRPEQCRIPSSGTSTQK